MTFIKLICGPLLTFFCLNRLDEFNFTMTNLVIFAVVFPPEVDAHLSCLHSNPKPESDGSYPSSFIL